jgi:predicted Zn-dependent protease
LVVLSIASSASLVAQAPDAASKFRLASALEQGGDAEHAAELYRQLYAQDPGNMVFGESLQRVLLQLKKYDEAVGVISARIARMPNDLSLRASLGSTLYRAGRENDAYAEWGKLIESNPRAEVVYRIVAASEIEVRLLDRAVETYDRGRKAIGNQNLFTLDLAQLLIARMDYRRSSVELIRYLKQNPHLDGFVQQRMAAFTGKPEGRTAAIEAVKSELSSGEDVPLIMLLQWLYIEGHDFDHAYETASAIDRLTTANGAQMLQFADRASHEKAYTIAERAYRAALGNGLTPAAKASAMYGLAFALKESALPPDTSRSPWDVGENRVPESGLTTRAIDAFNNVVAAFPGSDFAARSLYQIGLMRMSRSDLKGAQSAFNDAILAKPTAQGFRYTIALSLGESYMQQGDTLRARTEYQSVAAAPDATSEQTDEAAFHLAEIEFYGNHIDAASQLLDAMSVNLKADFANDALDLKSFLTENAGANDALAAYAKAEFLARQRRYSEAVAQFENVVARFPKSLLVDDALLRAGQLLATAGLFQQSAATYQNLIDNFKDRSPLLDRAQYWMARVYDRGIRDAGRAISAYEGLLMNYPNSIFADEARKRIRVLRGEAQ